MAIEFARDPRVTLMRDKYFSMRPKPLERWVWEQGLPASAERVFWYHWDLGAKNRTWCSQVPLRIVARECCLDPATVTRAYQVLKGLDLLRREDPGRDPNNPFQQATAVTEVRVPRALVVGLAREPNRRAGRSDAVADDGPQPGKSSVSDTSQAAALPVGAGSALPREESRQVFAKLSAGERTRFARSSSHRRAMLEFDADTRLTPTDRAHVLATLESLARARPPAPNPARTQLPATSTRNLGAARRVAALEILRLQKGLRTLSAARCERYPATLIGEVVYAVEEGSLTKFPVPLALNIALKKIREGLWSSPHRMPPDWLLRRALPEACAAAGEI